MATCTRRWFLAAAGAGAGVVGAPRAFAGEQALETTTVRFGKPPGICIAPQHVAEELLRAEGFTDIRYVDEAGGATESLARGKIDFDTNYASNFVRGIDAGEPITLLAGVHVGCFELFGNEGIRGITSLKEKSVGIQALGSNNHALLSLMAAQVGLDPVKEIHWITDPAVKPIQLFEQGKIDAFLGFPPEPQDLRARGIGHVIVNTAVDRPWSQYFCCLLGGNADYARKHPVATRRVVRAILKATDLCATEPARAARRLIEGGYTARRARKRSSPTTPIGAFSTSSNAS
jgi:NitT/TauT family transport system substrate-binding protein